MTGPEALERRASALEAQARTRRTVRRTSRTLRRVGDLRDQNNRVLNALSPDDVRELREQMQTGFFEIRVTLNVTAPASNRSERCLHSSSSRSRGASRRYAQPNETRKRVMATQSHGRPIFGCRRHS